MSERGVLLWQKDDIEQTWNTDPKRKRHNENNLGLNFV